jgi:hypothetical protein
MTTWAPLPNEAFRGVPMLGVGAGRLQIATAFSRDRPADMQPYVLRGA